MAKKFNDASIATVTSLTTSRYMNSVDPSTGELDKITVANLITQIGGGALIYAAQITQSSTSDPTAAGVTNNLGTTLTLSRVSAGYYEATAGAAIFTNKTLVFLQNISDTCLLTAYVQSTTVIRFRTLNAGSFTVQDGLLTNNSFKIEIYP